MSRQVGQLAAAALLALSVTASADQRFRLPPRVAPEVYGNLVIRRAGKPAFFSHWSHRTRYTCRVCHLELDFAMRTNTTEITEEANRKGRYCGACHNGKTAFAQTEANCARCHTTDVDTNADAFAKLQELPWSKFGNGIDWSKSVADGKIAPLWSLSADEKPIPLKTKLTLDAEWNFVPPALFPHEEHVRWLDCANCHPSIFNVKKKTTRHLSMRTILAGELCGVCHLRIAFPLDDCQRCHPDMTGAPGR